MVIKINYLEKFVEACIKKGNADSLGDYKTSNKCYKIINSVYKNLKKNNSVNDLVKLLVNENLYVKLWASRFTLQIETDLAQKTLREISKFPGLIGFEAKMTLKEWRKGNLKF